MEWYGDIFWSKFSSTFCPSFHSAFRPHLSILTGWWGRLHRGSQLRQDRAQPRLLLPARDTQGKSWHMTYYTWWHMTHMTHKDNTQRWLRKLRRVHVMDQKRFLSPLKCSSGTALAVWCVRAHVDRHTHPMQLSYSISRDIFWVLCRSGLWGARGSRPQSSQRETKLQTPLSECE